MCDQQILLWFLVIPVQSVGIKKTTMWHLLANRYVKTFPQISVLKVYLADQNDTSLPTQVTP